MFRKERIKYYRALRELIKISGIKVSIYIDESGFEEESSCIYALVKKSSTINN